MLKAILFDFDGVIIDSYESNTACFRNALSYYKYSLPAEEKYKLLLGLPVREGVRVLVPDATKQEVELIAQRVFLEADNAIPYIKLCDGVKSALETIVKGYKLAIVSQRRRESIEKIVKYMKIDHYFDLVIGREDVKLPKPNPEPLVKALDYFKVKQDEAMYIGDMEEDVLAAKAAKISCVFISQTKKSYDAEHHIKSIAELPDLIKKNYEI
jgi:HAD superfamily hydrolase (TIGR01549 family)